MQDNNQREYNFVIVNSVDRPSIDHIAQVMPGGGVCRYLHMRLRYWNPMSTEEAVNIKDFGFGYEVDEKRNMVTFFRTGPSTVKYKDGTIREWQDDDYDFSLSMWKHDRKGSDDASAGAGG